MTVQHVNNSGSASDSNVQRLGLGTTVINGKTYRMTAIYSGSPALSEDAKTKIGDLAKDLFSEVKTSGIDLSLYKFVKINDDGIHSENAKITDHTEKTTEIFNSIKNEFLRPMPAPSGSLPNPSNVSVLLDPVVSSPGNPLPRKARSNSCPALPPKGKTSASNDSNALPPLPIAKPVGVLGKEWPFFSDHLPAGISIDDFQMATWNVWNSDFIDRIENGIKTGSGEIFTSGLKDSPMTTLSKEKRDKKMLEMVVEMAKTRSVIALQEFQPDLIKPLQQELKKQGLDIKIVESKDAIDREVLLIDQSKFTVIDSHIQKCSKSYQSFVSAKIQRKVGGKTYQVVTTRLNSSPKFNRVSREELISYLKRTTDDNTPLIVLGDMNCEPHAMFKDMPKGLKPFNLYNNHIGTDKPKQKAKVFGQIWVNKSKGQKSIVISNPASSFGPLVKTSAAIIN